MGTRGKLMTSGDVADRLGVGRQRAYVLTRQRTFPEPFDEWPNGLAVWLTTDVEKWVATSKYADGDAK